MEKEIILPESVELVEEVKTLYKDKNGMYYLSKERAQEKLATHFKCKCGNGIREKYRIFCDACEPPANPKETRVWNGESMLYVNDFDKYFSNVEEIEEYCKEEEINKHTLTIYICDGNYLREVSEDYWEDVFAEDSELPKEIKEKLFDLNSAIKNYNKPVSYSPSKYIASLEWND
jgi:hypothetical protein